MLPNFLFTADNALNEVLEAFIVCSHANSKFYMV